MNDNNNFDKEYSRISFPGIFTSNQINDDGYVDEDIEPDLVGNNFSYNIDGVSSALKDHLSQIIEDVDDIRPGNENIKDPMNANIGIPNKMFSDILDKATAYTVALSVAFRRVQFVSDELDSKSFDMDPKMENGVRVARSEQEINEQRQKDANSMSAILSSEIARMMCLLDESQEQIKKVAMLEIARTQKDDILTRRFLYLKQKNQSVVHDIDIWNKSRQMSMHLEHLANGEA